MTSLQFVARLLSWRPAVGNIFALIHLTWWNDNVRKSKWAPSFHPRSGLEPLVTLTCCGKLVSKHSWLTGPLSSGLGCCCRASSTACYSSEMPVTIQEEWTHTGKDCDNYQLAKQMCIQSSWLDSWLYHLLKRHIIQFVMPHCPPKQKKKKKEKKKKTLN